MKKIVEENECGIIISDISPQEISNALIKVRDDHKYLNNLKKNAIHASEKLIWDKEAEKVRSIYSSLLKI